MAAVFIPSLGLAQQPAKVYRIATLYLSGPPVEHARAAHTTKALLHGLEERGFTEGQNLILDLRSAQGDMKTFYLLLDELVKLQPDVFFAYVCGGSFHLLRKRVTTIPIVVGACNDDLVAQGVVGSLRRPGGNITGLSKVTPELAAKRLSLAKELVPTATRAAVLWNPDYADFAADWQAIRAAASTLNITLQPYAIYKASDLEAAFVSMARSGADVLVTFSDTVVHGAAKRVAQLAATHRIPGIYAFREVADAGGLLSYGPNIAALYRESAKYIARIFNGANPADMPIEQPTKVELVINLKAARALGLAVPPSLLLRADEVIQ
jgi:putative ABC transport system substrate-binding protein